MMKQPVLQLAFQMLIENTYYFSFTESQGNISEIGKNSRVV